VMSREEAKAWRTDPKKRAVLEARLAEAGCRRAFVRLKTQFRSKRSRSE